MIAPLGQAQPTVSVGATAEATAALDATRFNEVNAALGRGDTETANRLLDEIEEELETRRRQLRPAQVEDRSPDSGELKPEWHNAEAVNREMERVCTRREERQRAGGKPAVSLSTTDDGMSYRDEHGNTSPLPRSRERKRLVAEMERFSSLSRPEQQLYQALGAVHERRGRSSPPLRRPCQSRRRPRPRARRPAAQRSQGPRSGSDPPDSDDPQPAVEIPSGHRWCNTTEWATLPLEPDWESIRRESDRRNDEEYERLVARARAEAGVR